MAATNVPTVVGFAMIAWGKGKAVRLVGYCTFLLLRLPRTRADR